MTSSSLHSSVHRVLLLRLAAATIILSLLFAALAFYTDQRRIEREVVDLARLRVSQFNQYVRDSLDTAEPLSTATLNQKLDEFIDKTGEVNVSGGKFVLVRIYDQTGTRVLDRADDSYESMPAVKSAVDAATIPALAADDFHVVTRRLEGLPVVGVALPLANSANEVVARVVGVFAVSAEAIDGIRGNILRTLAYVVGLVIATALAIYPIIGRLLDRLSRQTVRLLDSNLEILQVLGSAIAKRDSDTDAHNYRVSVYSVRLAETTGLPRDEIQSLIKGALLHDVGKLAIRDNVLLKQGKLTNDEFSIMKTHVEHGLEITARARWLEDANPVVGGHHEKFDGAGYPDGLRGEDIPVAARIFAITDVFDALTSRRPYKAPMPFDEAMEILESGRGSHFDPALLDAFCGIARNLYDNFSDKGDDKPRRQLESMIDEYFKRDAGDLLA